VISYQKTVNEDIQESEISQERRGNSTNPVIALDGEEHKEEKESMVC
jgi:hypothetical protein